VNIHDRGELVRHLDAAGLDGSTILKRADETEYAKRLEANTQLAAERGAFGSPTFIVGEDVFFGNDRLDFLEQRLLR
jgi:2-hydroxychromene-2-carboxylate isomerase